MKRLVEFAFSVSGDHPCLAGHFPGNPVVPGVLLLDHLQHALQQQTGFEISHLKQVKFTAALLPNETAQALCEIDGERVSFKLSVWRANSSLAVAEGAGAFSAVAAP